MVFKLKYILAGFALMIAVAATAATDGRMSELRDSLERILPQQTTAEAKINTLYNIYDLTTRGADKVNVLRRLYEVADSYDRVNVQFDALTHLANNLRDNREALEAIKTKLGDFVDSERKREVKLFVDMSIIDLELKNSENDDKRLESLFKRENFDAPADPYEHALMLFTLSTVLAKSTSGELLEQYMNRLEAVIETLPMPSGSVRNLIYTRAAPVFTNNRNYQKAVEIDKKMINIIDSLSTSYYHNGRPYRNLNTSRFTCCRRLLANYQALSPQEIESIYAKIQDLAAEDSRIASDIVNVERTKIFYCLATGRYDEAIATIKRQIDNPANKAYRLYFLSALVEASEKTGDKQTLLEASVELNKLLRDEIERRALERYRELEIIYDVNSLKEANAAAVSAHEESKIRAERIFAIFLGLAVVVLIILIIMLVRSNRKKSRLAKHQQRTSERLRRERNELKLAQEELISARDQAKGADKLKTDFINNMSHEVRTPLAAIVEYSKVIVDCVPEDKNGYLQRFANIIELNAKLIMTLLNDVLDIASLEHNNMSIDCRPVGVYEMCVFALDNLFEEEGRTSKGVEVLFNTTKEPDMIVETDRQRVAQVLINLLNNADKFTERGRITLNFKYDEIREILTFYVEDTGIGVPRGQAENIFSRFRKLDNSAPGCGLGLYISRLLAKLLGGDVKLDTDYRGGARFIFSIPAKV